MSEYVMRAPVGRGYVTLTWPKDLSADELGIAQAVVMAQAFQFLKYECRPSAGELEYASWFPQLGESNAKQTD